MWLHGGWGKGGGIRFINTDKEERGRPVIKSHRFLNILVLIIFVSVIFVSGCEKQSSNPPFPSSVSFNLPTSIQSITISDDSLASIGWTPKDQKAVLFKVTSWLNKATPYTGKIPQSQGPYVWHANVGPSELHVLTTDKHQIAIYPAHYIAKTGKFDTATSIDEHGVVTTTQNPELKVQYIQEVLLVDNNGERTFIKSEPLYDWLKKDQWKMEFERE